MARLKVTIDLEGDYTVSQNAGGDGHDPNKRKVTMIVTHSLVENEMNGPTTGTLETIARNLNSMVAAMLDSEGQLPTGTLTTEY